MLIIADFPREQGADAKDVTSFHPEQQHWGPDRHQGWYNNKDEVLFRYQCEEYAVPDYKVQNWYHDSKIVLDPDNHPVKNYRSIPS